MVHRSHIENGYLTILQEKKYKILKNHDFNLSYSKKSGILCKSIEKSCQLTG